jgi:hypothetical protein
VSFLHVAALQAKHRDRAMNTKNRTKKPLAWMVAAFAPN